MCAELRSKGSLQNNHVILICEKGWKALLFPEFSDSTHPLQRFVPLEGSQWLGYKTRIFYIIKGVPFTKKKLLGAMVGVMSRLTLT